MPNRSKLCSNCGLAYCAGAAPVFRALDRTLSGQIHIRERRGYGESPFLRRWTKPAYGQSESFFYHCSGYKMLALLFPELSGRAWGGRWK